MDTVSRFLLILAVCLPSPSARAETTHRNASYKLLVKDLEKAGDSLIKHMESVSGYVIERTANRMVFLVPADLFEAMVKPIDSLGQTIDRQIKTEDLTQNLIRAHAGLKSRQTMLERYLKTLGQSANRTDVIQIKGQLNQLVQQIESLQGQLRLMNHKMQMARLQVEFTTNSHKVTVEERNTSPFSWVNTVKVGHLIQEFQ